MYVKFVYRRNLLLLLAISLHLFSAMNAHADPVGPSVITTDNIVITTNEIPEYGELFKKYPLRWMIDKDISTAWKYEANGVPQLHISIPSRVEVEKIGIVNGFAKSRSLYFDNNRIKGATLKTFSSKDKLQITQKVEFDINSLSMQYLNLENKIIGPSQILITFDLVRGEKYNSTFISELDLISHDHSLISDTFIASNGGEYPDFQLFIDKKSVVKYVDSVNAAFFIEDGKYVVFKHGLGEQGITIINISTRKKIHVLKDLEIETVEWKDGYFVGVASGHGREEFKFKRKIKLP